MFTRLSATVIGLVAVTQLESGPVPNGSGALRRASLHVLVQFAPSICVNNGPAALHPRQRQTGREAGTQSQGPVVLPKGNLFVQNGWRPGYRKGVAGAVAKAAALAQALLTVDESMVRGRTRWVYRDVLQAGPVRKSRQSVTGSPVFT